MRTLRFSFNKISKLKICRRKGVRQHTYTVQFKSPQGCTENRFSLPPIAYATNKQDAFISKTLNAKLLLFTTLMESGKSYYVIFSPKSEQMVPKYLSSVTIQSTSADFNWQSIKVDPVGEFVLFERSHHFYLVWTSKRFFMKKDQNCNMFTHTSGCSNWSAETFWAIKASLKPGWWADRVIHQKAQNTACFPNTNFTTVYCCLWSRSLI